MNIEITKSILNRPHLNVLFLDEGAEDGGGDRSRSYILKNGEGETIFYMGGREGVRKWPKTGHLGSCRLMQQSCRRMRHIANQTDAE